MRKTHWQTAIEISEYANAIEVIKFSYFPRSASGYSLDWVIQIVKIQKLTGGF